MARPRLRDKTTEALGEVCNEHGFDTYDEAVTYLLRQEGYDV